MKIHQFTFNSFQENTYILSDDTKQCIIIDPGCYDHFERKELTDYIETNNLIPVKLVNTHCHLDHICGNNFVANQYNLSLEASLLDAYNLPLSIQAGIMYSFPIEPSPPIAIDLREGSLLQFGNTTMVILHTPGHSAGSLSFYDSHSGSLISGDVLFRMSVGRSDLPGGHHQTLLDSIHKKLLVLPKETKVYSGHGDPTTIGYEMKNNPFLN